MHWWVAGCCRDSPEWPLFQQPPTKRRFWLSGKCKAWEAKLPLWIQEKTINSILSHLPRLLPAMCSFFLHLLSPNILWDSHWKLLKSIGVLKDDRLKAGQGKECDTCVNVARFYWQFLWHLHRLILIQIVSQTSNRGDPWGRQLLREKV